MARIISGPGARYPKLGLCLFWVPYPLTFFLWLIGGRAEKLIPVAQAGCGLALLILLCVEFFECFRS